MLTEKKLLSKKENLLDYLSVRGAISQNSAVQDINLMQETIELEQKDFTSLCHHLSDAGWIKFLRLAGTWETSGKIGSIWLTPEGVEKTTEMRLYTRTRWLTKQASDEVRAQASDIIKVIEGWLPKQRYKQEEVYVATLAEHLEGKGIKAPEQQGTTLTDILAVHGIGIEVKVNPSRGEYDRLLGQIIRQLEEFGIVIALIIRPDRQDLLEEYKLRFAHDQRVTFITKG